MTRAEPRFVHELAAGRVVFAAGALAEVPAEARRLGARRALLIAGRHERAAADRVAADLAPAGRIDEVVQHVPAAVAAAGVRKAADLDSDLLVCIGGGSATGLAKIIARDRGTPILAVPTTYAGSEMSPVWGRTEDGRKVTGRDPRVRPAVVVYDPELTRTLPAALTATSGMNALAHAVEALYAPDASPIVTLLAEQAIGALAGALPACVARPGDLAARSDALYGAFLAGVALGNATMGVHHRICHVLGGAYDLPHGGTHAALLPYATAYNHAAAPGAMRRVAAALDAADAADAPAALWHLARRIGAPTGLRSVGFKESGIEDVAAEVAAAPPANPRPVTRDGVRALLTAALAGRPPDPD